MNTVTAKIETHLRLVNEAIAEYDGAKNVLIDLKTDFLQAEANFDTASSVYMLASNAAHHDYKQEQCRLDGLYKDAIQQVSLGGGTIDATYYDNGTSSVDVQVCFAAGEKAHLEYGVIKDVEKVEVGDMVMAVPQDDPLGQARPCRVVRVFHNDPQYVWQVVIRSSITNDTQTIRVTGEHPFFVKDKGWVQVKDLEPGDTFRNMNGEFAQVFVEKALEAEAAPVYNFEVENAHTYFVGEKSDDAVLVHNTCPKCGNDHDAWLQLDSWQNWLGCGNKPTPKQVTLSVSNLENLGSSNAWTMSRAAVPGRIIQNEIDATKQQIDYYNNAETTVKAGFFVASFFVPGPEDLVMAAVASKYGISATTKGATGAEKVLMRAGKKLKKGTPEYDDALKTIREYADTVSQISYKVHTQGKANHFVGKSIDEIEAIIHGTVKKGVQLDDPGGIEKRKMFYLQDNPRNKKNGIVVYFDGQGSGTVYRTNNLANTIDAWKRNLK